MLGRDAALPKLFGGRVAAQPFPQQFVCYWDGLSRGEGLPVCSLPLARG